MRKDKSKQQDYSSIIKQFRLLQAKPVPQKIQQIKKILYKNRQLANINQLLYTCIAAISNSIFSYKINKQQQIDINKLLSFDAKQFREQFSIHKVLPLVVNVKQYLKKTKQNSTYLWKESIQLIQSKSAAAINTTVSLTKSISLQQNKPKYDKNQISQPSLTRKKTSQQIGNYQLSSKQQIKIINQLNQQILKKNKQIEQLKQQNNKLNKQILKNKQAIAKFISKNIQMKNELINLYKYRQQIQLKVQQYKRQFINQCNEKNRQFNRMLQIKLQKINDQLLQKICKINMIQIWMNNQSSSNSDKSDNSSSLNKLQRKFTKQMQQITIFQLKMIIKKFDKIQQEFTINNQQKLTNKNNKINELQRQIFTKYNKLLQWKYKYNQLLQLTNKKQNITQIFIKNPQIGFHNSNILPIFNNYQQTQQTIQQIKQTQQFILNSVLNYYNKKRKIFMIKQLFGFQFMRHAKINFHLLVDYRPNIILLIKLKNNVVIGAYSQAGLSEKGHTADNRNYGFLFECKNNTIYKPRPKYSKCSILPYQDYYIIIGNRDVSMRMDSVALESCFGTQASLFRPNSQYTADSLIFCGKEETKTQLIDYQFYQVIFA